MDISNQVASIQNGLHTALGAVSFFTDILKDPQSLTNYITQIQQPEKLLQNLAGKGQDIEQDIANFLRTHCCGCADKLSPKYVEQASGQAFNQPYEIKGTKMYGFVIEGSIAKLQDICDKFLNNPNNGHIEYRPASPYILLTFNNIDSLSSIYAPDHEKGTVTEKEAIFWMLTVVGKRVGPLFIAERLAWFLPYHYVDNPITLVTGREVNGFFKQLGKLQIPNLNQQPDLFTLDTLVFKEFTPETKAVEARLLEIRRVLLGEQAQPVKVWQSLTEAIPEITGLILGDRPEISVPGLELPFNIVKYLIEETMSVVTLRQFRDIKHSHLACYQALVETPLQLETFHSGRLLGWGNYGDQFELKINNFASQPIVKDLGLHKKSPDATDNSVYIPVKLAFLLNYDFTLKNGVTVWQSPQK